MLPIWRRSCADSTVLRAERLKRGQTIATEALALFVKFWLTTMPPMPDTMRDAANARGRERYDSFLEALGRRGRHCSRLADRKFGTESNWPPGCRTAPCAAARNLSLVFVDNVAKLLSGSADGNIVEGDLAGITANHQSMGVFDEGGRNYFTLKTGECPKDIGWIRA